MQYEFLFSVILCPMLRNTSLTTPRIIYSCSNMLWISENELFFRYRTYFHHPDSVTPSDILGTAVRRTGYISYYGTSRTSNQSRLPFYLNTIRRLRFLTNSPI